MPFGRLTLMRRYHPSWYLVGLLTGLSSLYYFSNYYASVNEAPTINLKYLLAASIRAAEKGGLQVVRHSQSFSQKSKGKTEEGAEQYVTEADFKSHCAMYGYLKDMFPNIEIISEEAGASETCPESEYHPLRSLEPFVKREFPELPDDVYVPFKDITIWIDPLDATQEFTEHLTKYVTTMVCVAVDGAPVIGVIHKPFDSESQDKSESTFWSWVPYAISRNLNTFLKNWHDVAEDRPNIIISRSHAGSIAKKLESIFTKSNVTPAGGAGYKVLELVKGKATVYLHTTKIKKWDICAGNAILKAIGGAMTTLTDKPINYTSGNGEVNEDGVLASVVNHSKYYEIFKDVLSSH